jgi:hypothetical protein
MCCPIRQPPGLSAPGTDPRRRYLIKMEPRWKKKISEFLEMIPPLRGGDFQGITGLSSDDSLLVGVSTAREQSFKKAPALSNIGSMSPARLSLSTVASPHCRLLFHLAGKILAEKNTKVVRAAENQASVITQQGAGSQATVVRFRSGEKYFLDIPLYRSGGYTQISTAFDPLHIEAFGWNSMMVGIELRRAGCRWRVTKPALSIASWVLISTMATFSKAPL